MVEICHAKEQSEEQVTEIRGSQGGSTSFELEINIDAVKAKTATCPKCGLQHQKATRCPAIGRYCKNYNGRNHFASVCRTPSSKMRPEGWHVRQVEMTGDEAYFLQALEVQAVTSDEHWVLVLNVAGIMIKCAR